MTREEKIKAIYEEIADKTTSFGCWFIDKYGDKYQFAGEPLIPEDWVKIGHPVMIGDVLDYEYQKYLKNGLPITYHKTILWVDSYWIHKRLPIDEQSDECIDFIYSLIKK